MLSIINDNFEYCIEEPEINMRKLYNRIADILKRFKQLNFDEKKIGDKQKQPVIVKNYAMGQPSGTTDLAKFEKWAFVNDEQFARKQTLKENIQKITLKEMVNLVSNDQNTNQDKEDEEKEDKNKGN